MRKHLISCYMCKLVVVLLVFVHPVQAQVDTMAVHDSMQSGLAEKAVELLIKSDSIALIDSIHKEILRNQLDALRSFERSKRARIEKELEEIRQKDSVRKANMVAEVNRLKERSIGYPVIIHKDTLFSIYTKLGSLSAAERSRLIEERLHKLYKSFFLKTDSLDLVDNGQSVEVYFKDNIILSITELDELWYKKPKKEIASDYVARIESDIRSYKKDKSLSKKLKEIGLALLVVIFQIGLIKLINIVFRGKINVYLWNQRGKQFKGVRFRNHEIIDQNREASAIIFVAKLVRYALILLLLYLSIPVLFSIFPPTQRIAETLFGYILNPLKGLASSMINYLPELMTILVIVIVTRYFLKLLKFFANEIETGKINLPGFFPDWAKPSYNILKILVLAFMFIIIYPYLPNSESSVFKGVSVFLGIVFSLGSSSIVGNMVAGLVITYMRPFKIGDRIKIGEVVGNVVEKTPFVTRVRTPKKEFITIPNSNILASNVVNYSNSKLQGGLVVYTTVTIGYDVPWRKVHQILVNAAKKTSNLNMDIAPFVLQTSLDDFYVSYQVNAHTNEPDKQPTIHSELHQHIQDGFNEAGIEILSPHYHANRDGNKMTIPDDYLSKNKKDRKEE